MLNSNHLPSKTWVQPWTSVGLLSYIRLRVITLKKRFFWGGCVPYLVSTLVVICMTLMLSWYNCDDHEQCQSPGMSWKVYCHDTNNQLRLLLLITQFKKSMTGYHSNMRCHVFKTEFLYCDFISYVWDTSEKHEDKHLDSIYNMDEVGTQWNTKAKYLARKDPSTEEVSNTRKHSCKHLKAMDKCHDTLPCASQAMQANDTSEQKFDSVGVGAYEQNFFIVVLGGAG